MRSKKAIANIISSFFLQVVIIISGFIVPRYILSTFGSTVNGTISSITQFLGYISLIEFGIAGVIRASLYKPLANKNDFEISSILKSTELYFKRVSLVFVIYLIILAVIYPLVVDDFDWLFTFSLVIIIGISIISEYLFGITYQIMLQADQKRYINTISHMVMLVINTCIVIILIKAGCSIHIVKLGSALVFASKPIFLNYYVKRKYNIITECEPNKEALKQKWDGFSHHLANFIHKNTDIVLLTFFADIKEVSVYQVYYMIAYGIERVTNVFSIGLEASFGNMIAKNESNTLKKYYKLFEYTNFAIITIFFTSAGILALPFISLYTEGVTDVNYYRPIFSLFLILSEAMYCYRLPYQTVALASGHYKETRYGAIIEAIINIVISLLLVNLYGLTGVAIGTFIAMSYRTFDYAFYTNKHIFNSNIKSFIKRLLLSTISILLIITIVQIIPLFEYSNFIKWVFNSVIVVITSTVVVILISLIFFKEELLILKNTIKNILKR